MKRFVLWLAMWAGAFGPAFALLAEPPHDTQAAFDYACKLNGYDCTNVAVPNVEWADLYNTQGIFGGYTGTDTIYMDSFVLRYADPVFTQSVLAHEITHYLDAQTGLTELPYTLQSVCDSEFRAWRVGNAYVVSHGRPDLANYGWFIYYGCFQ